MEKKIIREAIKSPAKYFMSKALSGLTNEEINSVLERNKLGSKESRKIKGLELSNAIYINILKSNTRDELIENCLKTLKSDEVISREIVNDAIKRKFRSGKGIEILKRFVSGSLSSDEKKLYRMDIIASLIELVSIYNAINKSEVVEEQNVEEVLDIVNKNFEYDERILEDIKYLQKAKYLKAEGLKEISKKLTKNNAYETILKNYGLIDDVKQKASVSFEDELFDILNGGIKEKPKTVEKKDDKKFNHKKDIKVKPTKKEKREIKQEIITEDNFDFDLDESFKVVAKKLGYDVTRVDREIDKIGQIELLKDLASLQKGAVLSELYNVYTNIENESKDNVEAAIGNFFNKLRVLGFEANDEQIIGDDIIVDTKDALDKFIFSSPVGEKGEVIGAVKYRAWNYKGKEVTPMVIDVITD